jgi:4-carboxymuconolactone decarboxylase
MSERYERGVEILGALNGGAGERVLDGLKAISPDFARFVAEFIFGDIYSRPLLDLKTRQIVTISALASLGGAQPQLAVHLRGALRAGLSREEIIELLIQIAVYAGFPAAINALNVAQTVFSESAAAT